MSHSDILLFLLRVGILLFAARAAGELCQRLKQPAVIGEILAGILLGPSCLGALSPALESFLLPSTPGQHQALEVISLLGALFLLLITGIEIDLALIRRKLSVAIGIALGGLPVSLLTGYVLGLWLPDFLLLSPDDRLQFALFLAIALGISAIPVVAKVLLDLGLTRRDGAQTVMAAAMIDDAVGWILLSIVAGLATGASSGLASGVTAAAKVAGFLILSLTIGRWLIIRSFNFLSDKTASSQTALPFAVFLMFIWAAIGQALHLEAIFGAFVLGLVMSTIPRISVDAIDVLEELGLRVFGPLFFALAGLQVRALEILTPPYLLYTAVIVVASLLFKPLGVYAGARIFGKAGHWMALFFGAGLTSRGSMGIIVASVGLSLGILSSEVFSMIVLMSIITSVVSPPILRWTVARLPIDADEEARLQKEAFEQDSLLASVHRVLIPVRPATEDISEKFHWLQLLLLKRIQDLQPLSVTLLCIVEQGEKEQAESFLTNLSARYEKMAVTTRVVTSTSAPDAILDEAKKDYDLILMGATRSITPQSRVVFTTVVDYVFRFASCPVLLAQEPPGSLENEIRHILIPTNGSTASRKAAELGFALGRSGLSDLTVLKIVETSRGYQNQSILERQVEHGRNLVEDLSRIGRLYGIETDGEVVVGRDPEKGILETAESRGSDLLILGTNVRGGSDRLHLGPRVERILRGASFPVLVLNT